MSIEKKKLINKVQIIVYVILILFMTITFYLDVKKIIELHSGFGFIIFGLPLITTGVFGLIKNEVSIGNGKPLAYSSNSIVGKLSNILILILGVAALVIGVISIFG